VISFARAASFAMLLSGCGLIAGLRTDYELSEGGLVDGGEGGSGDARPDGPSCNDMIKNGTETDVDCGGTTCSKCAINKACSGDKDCQSNNCSSNKCRP
jgi:hypothetical protein